MIVEDIADRMRFIGSIVSFVPANVKPVIVLVVLLSSACSAEHPVPTLSQQLLGTWTLVAVRGHPPADVAITAWQITFKTGGSWAYEGSLQGALNGMRVNGEGRWKLTDRTLEYTAQSMRGASVVRITGNELTLTPDPVLAEPGTGKSIESTYRRRVSSSS